MHMHGGVQRLNCMADAELLAGTMLMALGAWQHDKV